MDNTVLLEKKFVDWWAYKCWLICTCNFTVLLTFYISFIITVSKKGYYTKTIIIGYYYKLGVILKKLHQNNNCWKFAVKALKITNFTVVKCLGGWGSLRFKLEMPAWDSSLKCLSVNIKKLLIKYNENHWLLFNRLKKLEHNDEVLRKRAKTVMEGELAIAQEVRTTLEVRLKWYCWQAVKSKLGLYSCFMK